MDGSAHVAAGGRVAGDPVDVASERLLDVVAGWIAARRPAAVVRFGEGEGRLLEAAADDPASLRTATAKLRGQSGVDFAVGDVLAVRALVLRAFDEADVVGIRGSFPNNPAHQGWVRRVERLYEQRVAAGRAPAHVGGCHLNDDLARALGQLVGARRAVSVVSCRDVSAPVAAACGLLDAGAVRVFQVPSQVAKRHVDGRYERALHDVPIWPDFLAGLRARLTVREPGEVFLVGAGLFGKELCIRVRELGGIALDMGAALDALAGKVTRGHRRTPPPPDAAPDA